MPDVHALTTDMDMAMDEFKVRFDLSLNVLKKIGIEAADVEMALRTTKDFYEKKHGIPVHFVGHPLLDALRDRPPVDTASFRRENGLSPDKPIIALLPGSRPQEISTMLPVMLSQTSRFPEYQFAIAGAPGTPPEFYDPFLKNGDALWKLQLDEDAALPIGRKMEVYHRYLLGTEHVADLEVVGTVRGLVNACPVRGNNLRKVKVGDRVRTWED